MTDAISGARPFIVLAVHGAPPRDFPDREMAEYFGLHVHREMAAAQAAPTQRECHLEARLRSWPRTAANDPFWAASMQMGEQLEDSAGSPVIVGFNEFCGPSVPEALDTAVARGASHVVVVTPMLTRGGEHAERDIPAAIDRARARHPETVFTYAWPYDPGAIARFLAEQVAGLLAARG